VQRSALEQVRQSVPLPAEALGPLLGPLPAGRLARLRARLRHHPRRNIRHHRNIRRRGIHHRDIHRRHTTGKMTFDLGLSFINAKDLDDPDWSVRDRRGWPILEWTNYAVAERLVASRDRT
jgi:hypothetical protein